MKKHSNLRSGITSFRRLAISTMLAFGLIIGGGTSAAVTQMLVAPEPVSALGAFENDYPDMDATDCSSTFGVYSWCKGGSWLSSRGYGYRNCTDGVSYWVNKYLNINPSGWGHAYQWNENAGSYTVKAGNSNNIEPGDIAQSDDGSFGHVGFVTSVVKNSSGVVTSFKTAEMNKAGLGEYSDPDSNNYSSKNAAGKFSRGASSDWDHFIDLDGAGSTSGNGSVLGHEAGTKTISLGNEIHNFYYDATHGNLRHSWSSPTGWNFENLDGDAGSISHYDANVGKNVDAVVLNGQIHLFYYDVSLGNLRHAWTTSTGWNFESLDGDSGAISHQNGDVGSSVKALVYGNGIQLFYSNKDNGTLRHAWTGPSGWNFENLDGDVGSVAGSKGNYGQKLGGAIGGVIHDSQIQLFYYDALNGNLRHAWTDPSGWRFENLDGDSGSVSQQSADAGRASLVLSYGSSLQVFYSNSTNGTLRHAWTTSSGWNFENLDGDVGSVAGLYGNYGQKVGDSIAGYVNGTDVQLFYYDAHNGNLRHAWTTPSGWNFENLDGDYGSVSQQSGDMGKFVNALNFNGSTQLFYYDATLGNLRHAWVTANGWSFETLDGDAGSISGYNADVY